MNQTIVALDQLLVAERTISKDVLVERISTLHNIILIDVFKRVHEDFIVMHKSTYGKLQSTPGLGYKVPTPTLSIEKEGRIKTYQNLLKALSTRMMEVGLDDLRKLKDANFPHESQMKLFSDMEWI